jgi:hypothetical protein
MPQHYVLTDAGLAPAVGSSKHESYQQPRAALISPDAQQAVPSAPAKSDNQVFDLRAVAREVQALGAQHLDRKYDAKTFKSNQLQQLGIKLPKKPRISVHCHLRGPWCLPLCPRFSESWVRVLRNLCGSLTL